MEAEKDARRLRKLLAAIAAAGSAFLEPAGTGTTLLLRIPGQRTLKCPRSSLEEMARSGWIRRDHRAGQAVVSVTDDGRSHLARHRKGGDFSGQHRDMGAGGQDGAAVNFSESPLTRLARNRGGKAIIDTAQLAAGERLRSDFEHAHLRQRVTASWDATHMAGNNNGRADNTPMADRVVDARKRYHAAIDAVGPELSGVLVDVCCFLKGLEQVEMERQWPRRSAKLMLSAALNALDRHYNPPARVGRGASRHWGADDYRPRLGR